MRCSRSLIVSFSHSNLLKQKSTQFALLIRMQTRYISPYKLVDSQDDGPGSALFSINRIRCHCTLNNLHLTFKIWVKIWKPSPKKLNKGNFYNCIHFESSLWYLYILLNYLAFFLVISPLNCRPRKKWKYRQVACTSYLINTNFGCWRKTIEYTKMLIPL